MEINLYLCIVLVVCTENSRSVFLGALRRRVPRHRQSGSGNDSPSRHRKQTKDERQHSWSTRSDSALAFKDTKQCWIQFANRALIRKKSMARRPDATAYGKYDQSVFSTHSSSAPTVRFTSELPSAGEWTFEYHFPYLCSHWEQYGRYNFTLRDNRQKWDLWVGANSLHGWIGPGTFDIPGPDVELDLISVEPANSIRVADAIRWKRVE